MTPLRIWNFPELPAFVSRQLPPAVLPPGRYQMPLPQSCHVAVTVNACPVRFLRTVPDPIAGRNSAPSPRIRTGTIHQRPKLRTKPPHQNRNNTPKAETPHQAPASEPEQYTKGRNSAPSPRIRTGTIHQRPKLRTKPPHQNRNNTPKAETPHQAPASEPEQYTKGRNSAPSPRIRTGTIHQRPKLRTSHQKYHNSAIT